MASDREEAIDTLTKSKEKPRAAKEKKRKTKQKKNASQKIKKILKAHQKGEIYPKGDKRRQRRPTKPK